MINIHFTMKNGFVNGLFTLHLNLLHRNAEEAGKTGFLLVHDFLSEYEESYEPCYNYHKNRIHLQLVAGEERSDEDEYTWDIHEYITH